MSDDRLMVERLADSRTQVAALHNALRIAKTALQDGDLLTAKLRRQIEAALDGSESAAVETRAVVEDQMRPEIEERANRSRRAIITKARDVVRVLADSVQPTEEAALVEAINQLGAALPEYDEDG